jgi:hypothetical protein
MKFHTKKNVGASTKHAQQVKCDIAFDAFVVQCPTRKQNSKVFYWTRTMINVANIFVCIIVFKKKHVMYYLESSFQPKGPRFNPFLNFFSNKRNGQKIHRTFK